MTFSFDLSCLGFDNFIKYVSLCLLLNLQSFQLWFFWVHFQPTVFIFSCQDSDDRIVSSFIKVLQPWVFLHILCCPEWIFSTILNQADQFLPLYSSMVFKPLRFLFCFFIVVIVVLFSHQLLYFSVKKNPFHFSLNPLSFLEAFYFLLLFF